MVWDVMLRCDTKEKWSCFGVLILSYWTRFELLNKVWVIEQGLSYWTRFELFNKVWVIQQGLSYSTRFDLLTYSNYLHWVGNNPSFLPPYETDQSVSENWHEASRLYMPKLKHLWKQVLKSRHQFLFSRIE